MTSFSIGRVEKPDGTPAYINGFDAMYVNAQKSGNVRLVKILEHRYEAHGGEPCQCNIEWDDQGNLIR